MLDLFFENMWWDFAQEVRLNDIHQRQNDERSRATRINGNVSDLSLQLQKVALVNQALYEILKEKVGISDEELRRKVQEIDRRDGQEDLRASPKPVRCPKCSSTLTVGALSCQVCGVTVAPKYPFEG